MASNQPSRPSVFRSGFNGSQILADLYEAALAGKGTDMRFELGPARIALTAHSNVIRSQSKVLDVKINDASAEKKQNQEVVIKLPKDDFEEFKLFLKFLYGNQQLTDRNFDVTIPVWKLAFKYGADNVLALFTGYFDFLKDNLSKVDVCKLILTAHEHHCEEILEAAKLHVKRNAHLFFEREAPCKIIKQTWYSWPLEIVIDILSTDSIKLTSTNLGWSANELEIVHLAYSWLRKYAEKFKPSENQMNAVATQVLQCVRFGQLDHEQFHSDECQYFMKKLYGYLKDDQISVITLVRTGFSEEDILKRYGPVPPFWVNRGKRDVQAPAEVNNTTHRERVPAPVPTASRQLQQMNGSASRLLSYSVSGGTSPKKYIIQKPGQPNFAIATNCTSGMSSPRILSRKVPATQPSPNPQTTELLAKIYPTRNGQRLVFQTQPHELTAKVLNQIQGQLQGLTGLTAGHTIAFRIKQQQPLTHVASSPPPPRVIRTNFGQVQRQNIDRESRIIIRSSTQELNPQVIGTIRNQIQGFPVDTPIQIQKENVPDEAGLDIEALSPDVDVKPEVNLQGECS